MSIKKILTAAAAVLTVGFAASPASADPWDHGRGYGYHDRDFDRGHEGWGHRFAGRDRLHEELRYRHIRFQGDPFFSHGRYVVQSYDRFGRVVFVEVNPYTGRFIGFVRL